MYVMTGRITFPNWQSTSGVPLSIRKFSSVIINRTFKQSTQYAEIVLPRNVKFFDKHQVRDIFRIGDEVIIELGYDGNLKEEFRGYVTKITADIPVTIRVDDEMWKIKRIPVNYVGKNVMLQDFLQTVLKDTDYKIDALEVKLGDIRFAKTNMLEVLDKLESDFNIYTYYQNGVIYSGKYYVNENSSNISYFNLERNVASNALNYRNKEDIILKIDAESITADGKKVTFSIGDEGGDSMRLKYFNITANAELEKKVKQDYENAKRGGFDGDFTAFGNPSVDFGEKALIESIVYPDRDGEYFIEGVEKSFDSSGYRQKIKLGGTSKLEGNG